MAIYADNLIDERTGRPIEGASLWVYDNVGAEATLTDALDQPLTQPLITDADGGFEYKVADGLYRHDFWKNSVMIFRDNRVVVGTPATVTASLGAFGVTLIGNATAADARADLELSGTTGAGLIGKTGGGTVQSFINLVSQSLQLAAIGVGLGIGTPALASAYLSIQTPTGYNGSGVDIYHYADQAVTDNQTVALKIHNYTNAKSLVIDTVGTKVGLSLKQAFNNTARPGFGTGTGEFWECLRARVAGGGVFPSGNIGGNVDKLTWVNTYGNLCFYGSDAQDWDGTNTKAPIQIGTYANFLNRMMYFGYRNDLNKSVLGSIDTGAGAFTNLDLAILNLRPIGDNAVGLGAASLRFTGVYAVKIFPGDGNRTWQFGTGSPAGVVSGNRGDIFMRTDGGASTTMYIKETNDGTVNGWRAV